MGANLDYQRLPKMERPGTKYSPVTHSPNTRELKVHLRILGRLDFILVADLMVITLIYSAGGRRWKVNGLNWFIRLRRTREAFSFSLSPN